MLLNNIIVISNLIEGHLVGGHGACFHNGWACMLYGNYEAAMAPQVSGLFYPNPPTK